MLPLGKQVILLDGGFGSELERLGLGEAVPEELNLTHPEAVRAIHKAYAEAGVDIITANSFGGKIRLFRRRADGRSACPRGDAHL